MPRINISTNAEKTSKALRQYYDIAKEKGLVYHLINIGGFNEDAIKTAIASGTITEKMLESFKIVFHVDGDVLIGEKDLPPKEFIEIADVNSYVMVPTDEETLSMITDILDVNKEAESLELTNRRNALKLEIVRLKHDLEFKSEQPSENLIFKIPQLDTALIDYLEGRCRE